MSKVPKIYIDLEEDTSHSISFLSPYDSDGEDLLADLFVPGATTRTSRVSSGASTGKPKGIEVSDTLDFTGIDSGNYYLKIWTENTGVLSKQIVIIK